jgi:hypothetical protein
LRHVRQRAAGDPCLYLLLQSREAVVVHAFGRRS